MQKIDKSMGFSVASLTGVFIYAAQKAYPNYEFIDVVTAAIPVFMALLTKVSIYLFSMLGMPTYTDKVLAPKIAKYIKSIEAAIAHPEIPQAEKEVFRNELVNAYKAQAKLFSNH